MFIYVYMSFSPDFGSEYEALGEQEEDEMKEERAVLKEEKNI